MLPQPAVWHPALVHFPIAFLALAGPAALVWALGGSGFWRRVTLLLLALGTVGVLAARQTGESLEESVEGEPRAERYLHAHEDAANWTLGLAAASLLVVGAAEAVSRRVRASATTDLVYDPATDSYGAAPVAPVAARSGAVALRAAGALLTLLAAGSVVRTGHLGGLMTWGEATATQTGGELGTQPGGERGTGAAEAGERGGDSD